MVCVTLASERAFQLVRTCARGRLLSGVPKGEPSQVFSLTLSELGFEMAKVWVRVWGLGFWVLGFGFWVLDFGVWVCGFWVCGFWVLGSGFWVLGFGFWIWGS